MVQFMKLVKYGFLARAMDALNTGKVDAASVLVELGVRLVNKGLMFVLLHLVTLKVILSSSIMILTLYKT